MHVVVEFVGKKMILSKKKWKKDQKVSKLTKIAVNELELKSNGENDSGSRALQNCVVRMSKKSSQGKRRP
jgi:hypothetical protein